MTNSNVDVAPKRRLAINQLLAIIFVVLMSLGLFVIQFMQHGSEWAFVYRPWALLSIVPLAINLGLLIYFLTKPARSQERVWLSVFLASLILYAVGEVVQRLSATAGAAAFWTNVSDLGVALPAAIYLFVLAYTNRSERQYAGTTTALIVGTLVYMFFLTFSDIIYASSPKDLHLYPWGYDIITTNSGSGPALLWFIGIPVLAIFKLVSFRRHTLNPIIRKQSRAFIWAIVIPLLGGLVTQFILPLAGVAIPTLYMALYTVSGFILLYGLLRYHLLTVSPSLFSNTILAIMEEAVIVIDDDFEIVYTNPKAEKLLDIKSGSTHRASLLAKLKPESAEAMHTVIASAASNTSIDLDRIDIKTTSDESQPFRAVGSLLDLTDMHLWIVALSDISKELQTRSVIEHEVQVRTKELQEARAYLLSSINSLEQGFVLLNAKLSVEVMNRAAQAVFKVKPNETANLALAAFANNADWDADLQKAVERVLTTKKYHSFEAAAKDGSFYQAFLSPVLLDDHILGVAAIIQDVTEQRIMDRSKDEFFSIASHELRTPLTAIRGNMAMVKDYFPEALKDESLATMITDTHAASVRLIAIVNDFLDSSKLEQGKMQFELKPTELAPIFESVQKDISTLLEKQHDKLSLEGMAKLPTVMADEARVRQIIYNLLSNAIKYGENATITVSGEVHDGKLALRFADTGKGISPENQKLLFHKFQQASDPLTRDDTKGTGLGLYISKLLAKNMHGDVTLEHSEEGKGSTFVLTLPLAGK